MPDPPRTTAGPTEQEFIRAIDRAREGRSRVVEARIVLEDARARAAETRPRDGIENTDGEAAAGTLGGSTGGRQPTEPAPP